MNTPGGLKSGLVCLALAKFHCINMRVLPTSGSLSGPLPEELPPHLPQKGGGIFRTSIS